MRKLETRPARSENHDSTRRRTVLGILGTSILLPDHWKSPIVQSVVLPAHAQTSPDTSSLSFANCSVSLDLSEMSITTFICADGDVYQIAPTVSGMVVGDDDVSGISLNIETVMTADGSPVPEDIASLNGTVVTAGDGSYSLELDGLAPPEGVEGPHILCTCEDGVTYEVTATISSDDPRLPGQTTCSDTFTCGDLPD